MHDEWADTAFFVMDSEPGRLYKMTLDGKIVGVYGESGRQAGQFNWPHGLACPSETSCTWPT